MRTSFDLFDICFIISFNELLQHLFYDMNYEILHHTYFMRSIEVFVVDDFEILIFFPFSFFPLPYCIVLYCNVLYFTYFTAPVSAKHSAVSRISGRIFINVGCQQQLGTYKREGTI